MIHLQQEYVLIVYFIELPYPTTNTDRMMVSIPTVMVVFVFALTPFHYFKTIPHILATRMINAMCNIQELAPLPNLLSPMP